MIVHNVHHVYTAHNACILYNVSAVRNEYIDCLVGNVYSVYNAYSVYNVNVNNVNCLFSIRSVY